MNDLEIRPVESADLPALTRTFGSEYKRSHGDDLTDQRAGLKSFLIVWIDGQPVGHALINWRGPRAPEPFAICPECPEIYRLSVLEGYRRQGIASGLIARCEAEAKARGFGCIGIGTDPELHIESNLYIRLGYGDSGAGIFDDTYERLNADRIVVTIREDTRYLIKHIDDV